MEVYTDRFSTEKKRKLLPEEGSPGEIILRAEAKTLL